MNIITPKKLLVIVCVLFVLAILYEILPNLVWNVDSWGEVVRVLTKQAIDETIATMMS